uniref:NB-ARC domain-containing protein n=1 Tax=Fagus sylvatica TaxID=28930 RepID=A0A2N9H7S8_FAGSY
MEIGTASFQVIFEKFVDYTIGVLGRQMGYLICYRSNVDNLKTDVNELKDARKIVDDKVKAATNNVEEIEANVLKWLISVEEITREVPEYFEEEGQTKLKCCHGWCPNLKARYQLSKRAYKMGLDVKKLIQDKETFHTIGHRVPIRGVTPIPTKGFEDFESRKSILEGIMKALKDDNIHAIGVCGMGGLGKTMLVGKVATQAMEEKLFETVVTVVVSQTPNLKQIQKDIAKELELKFEDEDTDFEKAHLLRERLKKVKILVIVDDIWNKLDLEALGISFGDNQKGSKLLLTSRFRDVLNTDMDAQELFLVGLLSKNEAENLFGKIVGDLPEPLNLRPTMVEVVEECAGLPIAITTVANALKNQKNPKVWKDALRTVKKGKSNTDQKGCMRRCMELPKRLECQQLKFILLDGEEHSEPIPNQFFEGVKDLGVLVLGGVCLPLPSSLSSLHNLRALVLRRCEIEDVAIIGELKKLKALTISTSIKKLPVEIGQLTHLQLLDLKGCNQLEVIPCNMLSNLKRLEELYQI